MGCGSSSTTARIHPTRNVPQESKQHGQRGPRFKPSLANSGKGDVSSTEYTHFVESQLKNDFSTSSPSFSTSAAGYPQTVSDNGHSSYSIAKNDDRGRNDSKKIPNLESSDSVDRYIQRSSNTDKDRVDSFKNSDNQSGQEFSNVSVITNKAFYSISETSGNNFDTKYCNEKSVIVQKTGDGRGQSSALPLASVENKVELVSSDKELVAIQEQGVSSVEMSDRELNNHVANLITSITAKAQLECLNESMKSRNDDSDSQSAVQVTPKKRKEKKAKEAQKKFKKKDKASGASTSGLSLEDFPTALENPFVPQFVYKCVSYIEVEGLKTEGLYRIPGNKAQGELFLNKFSADPNVDVSTLEIPVNAIATLLKSFFSDLSEALIPANLCDELMEAAEMTDKSSRLLMLRGVIKKLPNQSLEVLKYIISHLHKVAQHQEFNSMSCRNLAKCWWPTLIRLQFKTYEKLIQGSQIPEDIVHTLIEQCSFFFHGGNEV